MDKRFFLALFLSLIVIAVSQLLFPPAKPVPGRGSAADSLNLRKTASSTVTAASSTVSVVDTVPKPRQVTVAPANVSTPAETASVTTPKAVYTFSSLGATPVSIVIREYENRSGSGGLVDFGSRGAPLLSYRLITPTDTVDLSKVSFGLTRSKSANGQETLNYSATVQNIAVSIAYTISQDTAASYLMGVNGRVTGAQSPTFL